MFASLKIRLIVHKTLEMYSQGHVFILTLLLESFKRKKKVIFVTPAAVSKPFRGCRLPAGHCGVLRLKGRPEDTLIVGTSFPVSDPHSCFAIEVISV